jgi:hypothetical protein
MKAITYLQKELDNIDYQRNIMSGPPKKEDWPAVNKSYMGYFSPAKKPAKTPEEVYEQQYKFREEYDPT